MNIKIKKFIQQHTCASLCCIDEQGKPYCFSCYYAFNGEKGLLYYKSSSDTKHSNIILNNPAVAGTILPDKLNKLQVKGIQFEGLVLPDEHPLAKQASTYYYKKHIVGIVIPGEIWTVRIDKIKYTDNSLGFGKKLLWEREEAGNK